MVRLFSSCTGIEILVGEGGELYRVSDKDTTLSLPVETFFNVWLTLAGKVT